MNLNPAMAFVLAAGERAAGMFAGTLSSVLIAQGTDVLNAGWSKALSVSAMAALLSVLSSVAKGNVGPPGPSITETTKGAGRIGDP